MAHMAIKELHDRGIVNAVISVNNDGLHRKSGIDKDRLHEVNGNTYLEECRTCNVDYQRDFQVVDPYTTTTTDHKTSRVCDN